MMYISFIHYDRVQGFPKAGPGGSSCSSRGSSAHMQNYFTINSLINVTILYADRVVPSVGERCWQLMTFIKIIMGWGLQPEGGNVGVP